MLSLRRVFACLSVLCLPVLAASSCLSKGSGDSSSGGDCERGSEGCECYGNGTCDDDLACYSGLCVEPGNAGTDRPGTPGGSTPNGPDGTESDDGSGPEGNDEPAPNQTPGPNIGPGPSPSEPSGGGGTPSPNEPSPNQPAPNAGPNPTPNNPQPTPAGEDTPVARNGQLRVAGTKLVNQNGDPVQLKGASSMWLNWDPTGYAESLEGLRYMRDEWNLSLIRAAMGIEPEGAYLTHPDRAKRQVTTIVQNAIELGVYVLIDWHDHAAHEHQAEAVAFFTEMAQTFGDHPNVLYETYNEPFDVSWTGTLVPYHQTVISAIRQHDPDNVIMLGTPNWSQDVDVAAQSPVSGSNLMYALHFYACTHTSTLRSKAQSALSAGLPLFVTEWGATHADGGVDGIVCEPEAAAWHDWMDANDIGWAAWKLDGCTDATCYFRDRDVPVGGDWTADQLNGHVSFVIERMRRPAAGSQPSPTPSPNPSPNPSPACQPSGSCAAGNGMDCDEGQLVSRDCSACALLACGTSCCDQIAHFGATSQPTFSIQPELVSSFSANEDVAELRMAFNFSGGAAEQVGAIVFALDRTYSIDPANFLAFADASGGSIQVSLENGDAGCVYETYLVDDFVIALDTVSRVCWGSFTTSSPVSQINVRVAGYSSGSALLQVAYVSW